MSACFLPELRLARWPRSFQRVLETEILESPKDHLEDPFGCADCFALKTTLASITTLSTMGRASGSQRLRNRRSFLST